MSSFLLLDSSQPLEDEVGAIVPRDTRYPGFNMLILAPSRENPTSLSFDVSLVTNGGAGGTITTRALSEAERRCGGISNGVDGKGANQWPKVQHGVKQMNALLENVPRDLEEASLVDSLFEILAWVPVILPLFLDIFRLCSRQVGDLLKLPHISGTPSKLSRSRSNLKTC